MIISLSIHHSLMHVPHHNTKPNIVQLHCSNPMQNPQNQDFCFFSVTGNSTQHVQHALTLAQSVIDDPLARCTTRRWRDDFSHLLACAHPMVQKRCKQPGARTSQTVSDNLGVHCTSTPHRTCHTRLNKAKSGEHALLLLVETVDSTALRCAESTDNGRCHPVGQPVKSHSVRLCLCGRAVVHRGHLHMSRLRGAKLESSSICVQRACAAAAKYPGR